MFNSRKYWDERYKKNGNSGDGSYNELSEFKAEVINSFIKEFNINTLIDYGVGDGNQLKLIDTSNIKYTGIDVSPTIINKCKELFKDDTSKIFILDNNINNINADVVISCDVIYHLVEDYVYEKYMENLFNMSSRYVIIYARDEDFRLAEHVKFRKFTSYIEYKFKNWELVKYIENKYPQQTLGKNNKHTSPSNFYIYEKIKIKPRESDLLEESANRFRLRYIKDVILSMNLPKNSKILDIGGNNFVEFCHNNNFEYTMIDLKKPQKHGTGGYFGGGLTYNGRDLPFTNDSFDVVIISFVLHHASSNTIHLLKQIKNISKQYVIICEDLCSIDQPIGWHHRCFYHQENGVFRSDEEWKFLFNCFGLHVIDELNIRCKDDLSYSDPYDYIYRIQYTLAKDPINHFKLSSKITENIPLYISLTSIFSNQSILLKTLESIMKQTLMPNKIFLYLSEEPYLLDTGFENKIITNKNLLKFLENNKSLIELHWVENQGSYRKLLPLLKEKWNENCIIITIDDDVIYDKKLLQNMIECYDNNKCVIGNRGFTPKLKELGNFDYTKRKTLIKRYLYNFPTGKGAILYKPHFFYDTEKIIFNKEIYMNKCGKQDDVWFYLMRIGNNIDCYLNDQKYMIKDLKHKGLYNIFNEKDNMNTKVLHDVLEELDN